MKLILEWFAFIIIGLIAISVVLGSPLIVSLGVGWFLQMFCGVIITEKIAHNVVIFSFIITFLTFLFIKMKHEETNLRR